MISTATRARASKYRVRPARPDDAQAMADIDGLVNASPWSAAQFESACRPARETSEQALVIDGDDRAVGFVVFSRVLDEGCIHNIAVTPLKQGNGLGRSLLSAALARIEQAGGSRCALEVRASNEAAIALYDKLAFRRDGVRKHYYRTVDGPEDALLMSKQL